MSRQKADMGVRTTDLERFISAIPSILFLLDKDGIILFISDSATRYLGDKAKMLIGRQLHEADLPPGLYRLFTDQNQTVLQTGRSERGEVHFPTVLGEKWFGYDISLVFDNSGEVLGTVATVQDITERKRAEEALKESEARFRSLISQAPLAIGITRYGKFVYLNHKHLEMFGYEKPEELIGRPILELFAPQDRGRAREGDYRLMRELPESVENEFMGLRKDGSQFPFHVAITRIDLADGPALVGFLTDITKRKEAEEELKASQYMLQLVLDNIPDRVFWKDRDLHYLGANRTAASDAGLSDPKEIVGKSDSELAWKESAELYRADDHAVIVSGRPKINFEEPQIGSDGRTRWLSTSKLPLRDSTGRIIGVLGTYEDITERKRAEEALKESEEKARRRTEELEKLMDIIPAGIMVAHDPESRHMTGNRMAVDLHEHEEGEFLSAGTVQGEVLDSRRRFIKDGRELKPEELPIQMAATGKEVRDFEVDCLYPSGRRVTYVESAVPLKDDNGRVRGAVGVYFDITERKRAEEELEEAKAAAELYLDLLTHDINNYNAAAMGYLQLAEARLKLDERDRKLIQVPLQELRNSTELIANIRHIQRLEARRERIETIDLCEMLEELKREYENPPGREVIITVEEKDHCSMVASSLLRDAFSNIVSNAVKHSTGPLRIGIVLNPESHGGKEYMRVSVEDNGPGIPDEQKKKLFARSVRGLTKAVGHGLGLYLVKRLVEGQGGKVWVEDRVTGDHSKGARFVVLLPLYPFYD